MCHALYIPERAQPNTANKPAFASTRCSPGTNAAEAGGLSCPETGNFNWKHQTSALEIFCHWPFDAWITQTHYRASILAAAEQHLPLQPQLIAWIPVSPQQPLCMVKQQKKQGSSSLIPEQLMNFLLSRQACAVITLSHLNSNTLDSHCSYLFWNSLRKLNKGTAETSRYWI